MSAAAECTVSASSYSGGGNCLLNYFEVPDMVGNVHLLNLPLTPKEYGAVVVHVPTEPVEIHTTPKYLGTVYLVLQSSLH